MEKLTIKVNIIDRYYPLKIDPSDEERIREAAKKINDTVLQYQKVYRDKDSQDFLAMASLQFVTRMLECEGDRDLLPVIDELKDILVKSKKAENPTLFSRLLFLDKLIKMLVSIDHL